MVDGFATGGPRHGRARLARRRRTPLQVGDDTVATAFAHELRRFYPFAPFIGGRAVQDTTWRGERIPAGALVLLDLYGQNHDERLWAGPYRFSPRGSSIATSGPSNWCRKEVAIRGPATAALASRSPWFCYGNWFRARSGFFVNGIRSRPAVSGYLGWERKEKAGTGVASRR
jgi:hypothetical protein